MSPANRHKTEKQINIGNGGLGRSTILPIDTLQSSMRCDGTNGRSVGSFVTATGCFMRVTVRSFPAEERKVELSRITNERDGQGRVAIAPAVVATCPAMCPMSFSVHLNATDHPLQPQSQQMASKRETSRVVPTVIIASLLLDRATSPSGHSATSNVRIQLIWRGK